MVITGGPASEPIDEVRIITNHSTGELAVILARVFRGAGHQVQLFLGSGAIVRAEAAVFFRTNEDLERLLTDLPGRPEVGLVFHVAALADFEVRRVAPGQRRGKLSSASGQIVLQLRPKPKLIGRLRTLFPSAILVGWKYELDGDRHQLTEKARRQILENRTDACVINGRAFGEGFGFCRADGLREVFTTKQALAEFLLREFSGSPGGF